MSSEGLHEADALLCLGKVSEALYRSLIAEISQAAPAKGQVEALLDGSCIRLRFRSKELSGLRALLTSYMFLIHAAYSALEAVRG